MRVCVWRENVSRLRRGQSRTFGEQSAMAQRCRVKSGYAADADGPARHLPLATHHVPLFLDSGIAAITERKSAFTASDDLKIAATSGSRTTATTPSDIFSAKRFGLARL